MDKPVIQTDGSSRRRSMLPQRAIPVRHSTRLDSLSEQEYTRILQQSSTLQAPLVTLAQAVQSETNSMPPPASLRNSRSIRKPSMAGTAKPQLVSSGTRTPNTGRPPALDSVVLNAQTFAKSRSHGRSISHQVPKTAISRTSSSRANSRRSDVQAGSDVSLHGRSVSQQVPKTVVPGVSSLKTPLPRQVSLRSQKPAFSTLQQHYTPKKAIKPREPSPTSQAEVMYAITSADILHLQMELTQLHLLHRSASSSQSQWEQSAHDHFRCQFNILCERHTELKEIAHQQQTLINQLALVQWSHGKTGPQIAEKVQILSRNISDVCVLLDTEGKYTHIVEIFEEWFSQALRIREQRESKMESNRGDKALNFIEGIGDGWKAEAMVLERELTYYSREVKGLGSIQGDSSLGRIVDLYRKLIAGLIEEIDVVQWVENEIMVQEGSWVERTIRKLASNVSDDIGANVSSQE